MQRNDTYYLIRYPEYTRNCVECGRQFNAVVLGNRNRVTCGDACSARHTTRQRRENALRYMATNEKYKAYKRRYDAQRKKVRQHEPI